MPMASTIAARRSISPACQYCQAPSAPTGSSSAARDVPAALVMLNPTSRIRDGTITMPPPMPKRPESTPATRPIAATIKSAGIGPPPELTGEWLSRAVDAPHHGWRKVLAANQAVELEGESPRAALLRRFRRQINRVRGRDPREQVRDHVALAAD